MNQLLFSRKANKGQTLAVAVEVERIVVRLDGKIFPPVGSCAGFVQSGADIPEPGATMLRKSDRTHLLQGNVMIDADEADAIKVAKT